MTQSKNRTKKFEQFFDGKPKIKMDRHAIRMDSNDRNEMETFHKIIDSSCNRCSMGSGVKTMGTHEYNYVRQSTPVETA